jgi:hypothetical protein
MDKFTATELSCCRKFNLEIYVMRKLLALLFMIMILTSCGSNATDKATNESISYTSPTITAVTSYVPFYIVTETSPVNTDNLSAEELADYLHRQKYHLHEPAQDFIDLPYYDDFSDKEFTYKYMGSTLLSLWTVENGVLSVHNEDDAHFAGARIGYYGWQNYTASVDFKLPQDSFVKMYVYVRIAGDFESDCYGAAINSDGSFYAGNARGIQDYERYNENYGILVTGTFENFNPDIWSRIYLITEDRKLYISLNSTESIYICDVDPNVAGTIVLEASSGVLFDNLAIESSE